MRFKSSLPSCVKQARFSCIILSLSDGTDGLNRLVRSESRRRLPDPPSGVEPVTLQSQFHSANESVQLEQRMQGKTKFDLYWNICA